MASEPSPAVVPRTHLALALTLIIGGALGLLAAFSLEMDHILLLQKPDSALTCNINSILNCGKNIDSPQGSTFGFPNPILGLMMFPAPIVVGFALLAKARFSAWFWWIFNAGMLFAISFVYWLAFQSIFVIGTLCPWCALVYLVVIPMFLGTTVRNLRAGLAGKALQRFGDAIVAWVPLISILGYVIIFGAAQLQLNILSTLF
ncbi:vitamin K epoxide reductase family protein [Microbacterium sp. KUDC0406]|uniref:vitamin K epoxide reductase family protein n=1 Tax=Microbacterium sp. KUDC0406 TaxID=2909588 RepID=UPI001F3F3E6D|nr:vitamin K epoxide reductase family protein [Microbacterium sp. KUDC0406]UJP10840.1 vitamin K epoxide reductase family protein [Microbacterium sp. KUDC0406]